MVTQDILKNARNKFYPGWWMYDRCRPLPNFLMPTYIVVCENVADFSLAQVSRPKNVRANVKYRSRHRTYTISQAADEIGVSEAVLRGWVESDEIHVAVQRDPNTLTEEEVKKLALHKLLEDIRVLFEDPDAWLDTPNPFVGGATPRALLGTDEEDVVRDAIESIKHGMVS